MAVTEVVHRKVGWLWLGFSARRRGPDWDLVIYIWPFVVCIYVWRWWADDNVVRFTRGSWVRFVNWWNGPYVELSTLDRASERLGLTRPVLRCGRWRLRLHRGKKKGKSDGIDRD